MTMRLRVINKPVYTERVRRVDYRLSPYSNNTLFGKVTVWTTDGKVHNHNGHHHMLKWTKKYGFVITTEK